MKKLLTIVGATLLLLSGCKRGDVVPIEKHAENLDPMATSGGGGSVCTINLASLKQAIRGFGGSSAWHGQLTDADCDKLFTTLGLSILRVRIDPDSNWNDEIVNAQKATARGAMVFASPWSPPAHMKNNNSTVAGSLLPEHYGDYADWLNSFVNAMNNNGVPLYAVSVQNEPNINVTYESCSWTATQMLNFMVNNAGAINTKVMMPETFNYLPSYADPILNNATGAANTDICAHHWYGANRNQLWSNAYNKGKDIWMTEYYSNDQSLNAAIATAVDIHKFLTINNDNAYVWWYVKNRDCNLITDTGINKRGYVMAQFAKFVRPGYNRVDVSGGNNITAYTDGSKAVVVAVNSGTSSVIQKFSFQNGTITSVVPYVTSGNKNLQTGSSITVTSNSFTYTLEPKSVTTFVQE
jgi:glucuronoarabinoxylan endo-1,4-beta-xylanase